MASLDNIPGSSPVIPTSTPSSSASLSLSQRLANLGNIAKKIPFLNSESNSSSPISTKVTTNVLNLNSSSKTTVKTDEKFLEVKLQSLKGHVKNAVQTLREAVSNKSAAVQDLQLAAGQVYNNVQNAFESLRFKHMARVLPRLVEQESTPGGLDVKDKQLHREVEKTVRSYAKAMEKNQIQEVNIPALNNHTVIIVKKRTGKVDVFVKGERLGQGAARTAYKATSAKSGKEKAFKVGVSEDVKEEHENELAILDRLNEGKPKEGVQGKILASDIYTIETRYKNRDLQSQVEPLRMANLLGIKNQAEFKSMDKTTLQQAISNKIAKVADEIEKLKIQKEKIAKQILDELELSTTKNTDQLDKLGKEMKDIDKKLSNVIDREVDDLNLIYRELLGKTKSEQLLDKSKIVQGQMKLPQNKENIIALLQGLLGPVMLETAEACRGKSIDLKKRMQLASNLVNGLITIHDKGIIHGDIKPKNFLWNDDEAVIADFGASIIKGTEHDNTPGTTPGYRTNSYIDAMVLFGKANDEEGWFKAGRALDMRAMGVSLYEMFTGNLVPLEKRINDREFYNPKNYDVIKEALKEAHIPDEIANIIAKMATPLPFDEKNPQNFKLPVETKDLQDLAKYLKTLPPTA